MIETFIFKSTSVHVKAVDKAVKRESAIRTRGVTTGSEFMGVMML